MQENSISKPLSSVKKMILQRYVVKGLRVRDLLLQGGFRSVGRIYDAVDAWREDLHKELMLVAPDLADYFSYYANAVRYEITQDKDDAYKQAVDDIYKLIVDLEEMMNGEYDFSKTTPHQAALQEVSSLLGVSCDSITLVYDGVSLYDKLKPDKLNTLRKGSMPYKIMQAFYRDPSLEDVRTDVLMKRFDSETFRKWQGKLAAFFECSSAQIRSAIHREGRRIFITDKLEIIRRP